MTAASESIQLPPPIDGSVDVLFVAGEHSGDEHASAVVESMLKRSPGLKVAAVGGGRLEHAGAQLLHDLTATSVVGLVEVLRHYRYFKRLFDALLDWIEEHRPQVIVLVDYPGFNLRLAAALKARGLSRKGGGSSAVYAYISPQIWAWKARRRFRMAELLDEVGVIFPFEVACYADTSLEARFVGHPFLAPGRELPLRYDPAGPVLLLPGSRLQPIARILPAMLRGAAAAGKAGVVDSITVIYPGAEAKALVEQIYDEHQDVEGMPRLELAPAGTACTGAAVLTSSGTMSLACALGGIPGAIVYRAHPLTYAIGRRVVKIPFLGIANLILNRVFYPEYIQGAATPGGLASELRASLRDPQRIESARGGAVELREALSAPSEEDAAERILHWLK